MITTRELADNNTSISSTRWAFVTIIKFDIIVIASALITFIVGHFIGKPFSFELFSGIATLLGIPTGFITVTKSLQGFETNKESKEES